MFPMTVSVHNQSQLNAVIAALAITTDGTALQTAQATVAASPVVDGGNGASSTPATSKAITQPAAAAAPAAQQPADAASSTPSAASDTPVTYEQVKAAVLDACKRVGNADVQAALRALGVAKAPELQPAQYANALAKLNALEPTRG